MPRDRRRPCPALPRSGTGGPSAADKQVSSTLYPQTLWLETLSLSAWVTPANGSPSAANICPMSRHSPKRRCTRCLHSTSRSILLSRKLAACAEQSVRVHHILALAHQQQENNTTHLYHFKLLRHAQPVHKLRIPLTQLAVPCCLLLLLALGRDVILNRSIQINRCAQQATSNNKRF